MNGGEFTTTRDGVRLAVKRWQPSVPRLANVFLLHGFGEHAGRYDRLGRELSAAGYSLTSLDHRGHGRSGGPRAVVPDAQRLAGDWLDFLASEAGDGLPRVLMGHSMGGPVAAQVALAGPGEYAGLVLSSPYLQPARPPSAFLVAALGVLRTVAPGLTVEKLSSADLSRQPEESAAYDDDPLVHHGGVSARSAHSLLTAGRFVLDRAGELELPLLILHGAKDSIAGIEGSRQLLAAAGSRDKRIVEFAEARHEVMNDLDREQFYAELLDWLAYRLTDGAFDED